MDTVEEGHLHWDALALHCRNGQAWLAVPDGDITQDMLDILLLNRRGTSWHKAAAIAVPSIEPRIRFSAESPPAVYWWLRRRARVTA